MDTHERGGLHRIRLEHLLGGVIRAALFTQNKVGGWAKNKRNFRMSEVSKKHNLKLRLSGSCPDPVRVLSGPWEKQAMLACPCADRVWVLSGPCPGCVRVVTWTGTGQA